MDFIDSLPFKNSKSVILVVVDRLTTYGRFLGLSHPYTAQSVAKIFSKNIFKLHGMPATIVYDRDPVFTSCFGRKCLNCRVSGYKRAPPTILKPMANQKYSIVVLKTI